MAEPKLKLKILPYALVSNAGLALVGEHLNKNAQIGQLDKTLVSKKGAMPTSQVLSSYIGLLAMGKSDFEAIEGVRKDRFFAQALYLNQVPSTSSLRMRMEKLAKDDSVIDALHGVNERFLRRSGVAFDSEGGSGRVMCDVDVFTQDNSGTKKEGVQRTYAGFDGYAPIAAYLGVAGWCIGMQRRLGGLDA